MEYKKRKKKDKEGGRLVCLLVLKQMSNEERSSQRLRGEERDGEKEFEWVSFTAFGKLTVLAPGLWTRSCPLTHTPTHILPYCNIP